MKPNSPKVTVAEHMGPKSFVSVTTHIPEPVTPPPPMYTITLVLDKREAEAIMQLCMQVGGNREISARGVATGIAVALSLAGVAPNTDSVEDRHKSIYFKDYGAYTKS